MTTSLAASLCYVNSAQMGLLLGLSVCAVLLCNYDSVLKFQEVTLRNDDLNTY